MEAERDPDLQEEEPKRFKIRPKVYILGFFALMYLLRNIYTHYTTERPPAPPTNTSFFSQKEFEENSENVWLRTRNQLTLIAVLVVVFMLLRWINQRAQQRQPQEFQGVEEEQNASSDKGKKKKKK